MLTPSSSLAVQFLEVPDFRNVTLKCLSEIAALSVPEYDQKFVILFKLVISAVNRMIPPNTSKFGAPGALLFAEADLYFDTFRHCCRVQ